MAKRAQRAANHGACFRWCHRRRPRAPEARQQRILLSSICRRAFAFQLDAVGEILRLPNLARMPLAPQSSWACQSAWRGFAGGRFAPSAWLPCAPLDEAARVIVIDQGAPVAFVVDRIENLVSLPTERIEKDEAGAGGVDPSLLDGVIKGAEGESSVKILNPSEYCARVQPTWRFRLRALRAPLRLQS